MTSSDKTKSSPIIIGLFKDNKTLEKTLHELRELGFWSEDIAIIANKHLVQKEGTEHKKTSEGATTGLVAGITAGGILGWLASLDTFFLPSVGLMVAAGPLASALAGIAIGGTVGSLSGAFIKLGVSKFEAKRLEKFVKDKGIVISVHANNLKDQLLAKNIFVKNGATKIFNTIDKKTKAMNFQSV